jgi:hypothetical protein
MSTISRALDTFDINILKIVVEDLKHYLNNNFGLNVSIKKRATTASDTQHATNYHYLIYMPSPLTFLYKISTSTYRDDTKHVEYVNLECPVLDLTKKLYLREFVSNIRLKHEIEEWTKLKAHLMVSVVQNEHKKRQQSIDDESASHNGHTLPNFDFTDDRSASHHGHVMTRNAQDLCTTLEHLHRRLQILESQYEL